MPSRNLYVAPRHDAVWAAAEARATAEGISLSSYVVRALLLLAGQSSIAERVARLEDRERLRDEAAALATDPADLAAIREVREDFGLPT